MKTTVTNNVEVFKIHQLILGILAKILLLIFCVLVANFIVMFIIDNVTFFAVFNPSLETMETMKNYSYLHIFLANFLPFTMLGIIAIILFILITLLSKTMFRFWSTRK